MMGLREERGGGEHEDRGEIAQVGGRGRGRKKFGIGANYADALPTSK